MHLERLGATPQLRASLAPGLILARVTFSHRDHYRLIADSGELDAEPSGALPPRAFAPRYSATSVLVSGASAISWHR